MQPMPTDDDLRAHVLDLLKPVCEPLYELWEEATDVALNHLRSHGLPVGGWEQSHLTRAHAQALLRSNPLPGLNLKEPCLNGRMLLSAEDGTTLRMLHASDGHIPPPGRNQARIRYYQQQQFAQLAISSTPTSCLLGIWAANIDGSVGIRIVRPIGTWSFGSRAKVDLDLDLPRTYGEFQVLEFRPDDTGLELQIPDEEANSQSLVRDLNKP